MPAPRCATSCPQTRSRSPCRRDSWGLSCLSPRVDDVDVAEAARHAAVAHRVDLSGLPLSIEEAGAHLVALLAADHVHGVPEVWRAHLVGDVLQHAGDLATLDLIEELTAELRIVALLVDREASVADDGDPLVGRGEEDLVALLLCAGQQGHVRHALELYVAPGIGMTATMTAHGALLAVVPPLEHRRL